MRHPSRYMLACAGVIAAVAIVADRVSAQPVTRVASEPSCPGCSIGITPLVRLGTMDDPYTIHSLTRAAADGTGRVYLAPLYDASRIGIVDMRTGAARLFGRSGAGPGEFSMVFFNAVGAGDTLFAFEGTRFTVLTRELQVVSVRQVPIRARNALVLNDGNLLVNAHRRTASGIIEPLHIVDREGRIVKSFGAETDGTVRITNAGERMAYDHGATADRALAYGDAGRFWTGGVLRYELDLWNSSGDRLRRIIRDAGWYPPRDRPSTHSSWERPPDPMVAAVRQDHSGRLWVAVWVADTNWREQKPSEFRPSRSRDTIIEVLDLRTMRLLASTRIDGAVTDFLTDDVVVTREEDASGLMCLQLWRFVLNVN